MGHGSRLSLQNRRLGGGEMPLVLDLERVVVAWLHRAAKRWRSNAADRMISMWLNNSVGAVLGRLHEVTRYLFSDWSECHALPITIFLQCCMLL